VFSGLCSLKVKPIAFNILIRFMLFKRNRTSSKYIYYALKLYFSGLSLRKTSNICLHLSKETIFLFGTGFNDIISQVRYISQKRKKVSSEFIIDETLLKVRNEFVWLWIAIEPIDKIILGIRISFERTMLVAERFLQELVRKYGKHPVSTDGGTWYPQACKFLNMNHHLHSSYEKSMIERTIQYIKDRTESFDDYFPCRKEKCKLQHIRNWFNFFVDYHNTEMMA
jgi:putative transposase